MDNLAPSSALSQQVEALALKKRALECSSVSGAYNASFWSSLFSSSLEGRQTGDDLVFFVNSTEQATQKEFTDLGAGFFVRRRAGSSMPRLGCDDIDWEATYLLNAICNSFEFKLIVTARR
jgi:hypothetical protein